MYNKNRAAKTSLKVNVTTEGETIEAKIRRIVDNGEPITDGAPLIYTDRADGVLPEYNVRTDRFELAVEAMDGISRNHLAKREARNEKAKDSGNDSATAQGGSVDPTAGGTASTS